MMMGTMADSMLCRTCGLPATHVHFIPWVEQPERIELACATHEPGGEWYTLAELAAGPAGWLRTLERSGSSPPHALVAWLSAQAAADETPAGANRSEPPAVSDSTLLLSRTQAAKLLSISADSFDQHVRHKIKTVMIGDRPMFERADVLRFSQSGAKSLS